MPIKIAICDDSEKDAALLSNALLAYDPLFEIVSFPGGQALLDELSDGRFVPDLVFLDIYMPGLDGIETARKIRSFSNDVRLIILSSSRDHYPQAYEVFAFNYLVKPFDQSVYTPFSTGRLMNCEKKTIIKSVFNIKAPYTP